MYLAHSFKRIILLIIILIGGSVISTYAYAQEQTPTTRESLIQAIEKRAQRDVELGRDPINISELEILFGNDADLVGMTINEVLEIYEEAYTAAIPERNWWEELEPNAGWIAAGALLVLTILGNVFKEYLARFFKWLAERAYNLLAGYKPFWWISLRRYRRSLVQTHQEIKIPFRPGRPLKMGEIYVPIKAAGSDASKNIDVYNTLSKYSRIMVVGAPGSGKTMLLKHIALTYAREGLNEFHGHPIPILLELHRLNDPSVSLINQLAAVLKRHKFPNAQSFVKNGLKHGHLMLLLDGLDEVNKDARARVITQIKDLFKEHKECRVVVTCRTAVYNDELSAWNDQHLEIVEFSDQQIHRFLSAWEPEMPSGKSVEHLLHSLNERPRIMALSRNPLLLTIIAYLYSDTPFILPHSRTEFYERSTNVLLDQWDQSKQKRNQYKAVHKRLVLQHLALFYQERASTQHQDRRSASLPDVLTEIKKVLPSLNMETKSAQPILDEIVERSGLILAFEGGERYQFTHLTLQEYFAALALEGISDQLITKFTEDPGAWRETVKLWCGLEHDSTDLIKAVSAQDPITALECLGDTQQIDSDYAEGLIQSFLKNIMESDSKQDAVKQALAMVAADPRPRGQTTLENLINTLASSSNTSKERFVAAEILSLTNLPQAAFSLAEYAGNNQTFRPFLIQMGNLAIPALEKWATEGHIWAIDALHEIGTPQAALTMLPLLWHTDELLQEATALRLGSLLSNSTIEIALYNETLSQEYQEKNFLNWVWEPFDPNSKSPLRIIAGRIAYLLNVAREEALPSENISLDIDPRLVIPVCAVAGQSSRIEIPKEEQEEKNIVKLDDLTNIFHTPDTASSTQVSEEEENYITNAINTLSKHRVWQFLVQNLQPAQQLRLVRRLLTQTHTPTIKDWQNIFKPISYTFENSWQARFFNLGLFTFTVLGIWQMVKTILQSQNLVSWENGILVLLILILGGAFLYLSRNTIYFGDDFKDDFASLTIFTIGPIAGTVAAVVARTMQLDWIGCAVAGAIFSIISILLNLFFDSLFELFVDFLEVVAIMFIIFAISAISALFGGVLTGLTGGLAGGLLGASLAIGWGYLMELDFRKHILPFTLTAVTGALIGVINSVTISELFTALVFGALLGIMYMTIFMADEEGYLDVFDVIIYPLLGTLAGAIIPLFYYPTEFLFEYFDWPIVVAIWILWLVFLTATLARGYRLERLAKNPLQGLLETESASKVIYRGERRKRLYFMTRLLPFLQRKG